MNTRPDGNEHVLDLLAVSHMQHLEPLIRRGVPLHFMPMAASPDRCQAPIPADTPERGVLMLGRRTPNRVHAVAADGGRRKQTQAGRHLDVAPRLVETHAQKSGYGGDDRVDVQTPRPLGLEAGDVNERAQVLRREPNAVRGRNDRVPGRESEDHGCGPGDRARRDGAFSPRLRRGRHPVVTLRDLHTDHSNYEATDPCAPGRLSAQMLTGDC